MVDHVFWKQPQAHRVCNSERGGWRIYAIEMEFLSNALAVFVKDKILSKGITSQPVLVIFDLVDQVHS